MQPPAGVEPPPVGSAEGAAPAVDLAVAPPLGPLFAVVSDGRLHRLGFGRPPPVRSPADGVSTPLGPDDLAVIDALQAGIARWLDSGDARFAVPVDLDATGAFRAGVYRQLTAVGAGERITYAELARRCGHPGAARAVGQTMAANPWPLLVPCHRVVPASGGVGNYAGGTRRKGWMLAVEAAGGVVAAGQVGP